MDARSIRIAIGAGVAVLGIAAVVVVMKRDVAVVADVKADAGVKADADVKADAEADAEAKANAKGASAIAVADASHSAHASSSAVASSSASSLSLPGPTVNLDEASDGKTIELTKGQSVVLMLPASPTSGFDWAVLKAPPALGSPGMGFVAGGDAMGASGKRRIAWTLKDTLPAGEHGVELGYARSFEKGVAPFKTFRFKVRAAH